MTGAHRRPLLQQRQQRSQDGDQPLTIMCKKIKTRSGRRDANDELPVAGRLTGSSADGKQSDQEMSWG